MIIPATDFEPIRALLYQDPFANATLINTIERRLPRLPEVWVLGGSHVQGALALTTTVERRRHVSLEAESAEALTQLLEWLPPGDEYAFALHREWQVPLVKRLFIACHESTMDAYRCAPGSFQPHDSPPARALKHTDARAVRRARDAQFALAFEDHLGGRPTEDGQLIHAFGLLLSGRLVSRCITTWSGAGIEHEIGTVWSVVTEPEMRSRGYARSVVSTATRAILASHRIARYLTFSDNRPSIHVCQALGYQKSHEIRFYRGRKR